MSCKKKLIRQHKKVVEAYNELSNEIGKLNAIAIKITGLNDLWADVTTGGEIEFHDERNGGVGGGSYTLSIEDIIQILKKGGEK